MSLALEVVGLDKQFSAGLGSCLATNSVLRGLDLEVDRGEVAAIVGRNGSGRSTLLLCIAGLLVADNGSIRWFGDASRQAASRLTRHYLSCEHFWRTQTPPGPAVHLVDLGDLPAVQLARLRRRLIEIGQRGDAAVVVTGDVDVARHLADRVLLLRQGRLSELSRARARVAEASFVDRPFERV